MFRINTIEIYNSIFSIIFFYFSDNVNDKLYKSMSIKKDIADT